jgi:hypothetical protein
MQAVIHDTAPPTVTNVVQLGTCDNDNGGHHSSVAYNNLGNGDYVRWYQNLQATKAIYRHASNGALVGSFPTANLSDMTVPLTNTRTSSNPYAAFTLAGSGASKTLRIFRNPSGDSWIEAENLQVTRTQLAVRTFVTQTATLNAGNPTGGAVELFLSVSSWP